MLGDWSTSPFIQNLGTVPTIEHDMLGNWSTSPFIRNLGTVPTTEHDMLGDWSIKLAHLETGDSTDDRAWYARGMIDQSVLRKPRNFTNH